MGMDTAPIIERDLWPVLKRELGSREILVITGPRQVGKTTTLKWLIGQVPDNALYLDLTLVSAQRLFESEDFDVDAFVTQIGAEADTLLLEG